VAQRDWQAALILHRDHGWTYRRIAERFGCRPATVSRHIRALGHAPRRLLTWRNERARTLYSIWYRIHRRRDLRRLRIKSAWERFEDFYDWAVASGYRRGLRLVRADDRGDYSPANCSWGRAPGTRFAPTGSIPLRAFGEVKTIAEWVRDPRCVVAAKTLRERLIDGVEPEAAMTRPATPGVALPRTKKPVLVRRFQGRTDWARARRLRAKGLSMAEIARQLGVPYGTIQWGFYQSARGQHGRTTRSSSRH
jgi:transcriptional regulator with XRE-family HTH domain